MMLQRPFRTTLTIGVVLVCAIVLGISGYQILSQKAWLVTSPEAPSLPRFTVDVPDNWFASTTPLKGNSLALFQKICDSSPAQQCPVFRSVFSTEQYDLVKDCGAETDDACFSHIPSGAYMMGTLFYKSLLPPIPGNADPIKIGDEKGMMWPAPHCQSCSHAATLSFEPKPGYRLVLELRVFSNPASPLSPDKAKEDWDAMQTMLQSLTIAR
jgi:hypothetical protein